MVQYIPKLFNFEPFYHDPTEYGKLSCLFAIRMLNVKTKEKIQVISKIIPTLFLFLSKNNVEVTPHITGFSNIKRPFAAAYLQRLQMYGLQVQVMQAVPANAAAVAMAIPELAEGTYKFQYYWATYFGEK